MIASRQVFFSTRALRPCSTQRPSAGSYHEGASIGIPSSYKGACERNVLTLISRCPVPSASRNDRILRKSSLELVAIRISTLQPTPCRVQTRTLADEQP